MKIPEVAEKEFKVLSQLGNDANITQRQISQNVGLSLGLVNIILKKLIKKGYVKIKRLNRRNLQYFLTPKGFSEISRRSYQYFRRTMNSVRRIKEKIQELVLKEYSKGKTEFIILGDGELADIVEITLRNLNKKDLKFRRARGEDEISDSDNNVVLVTEDTKDNRLDQDFRDPGRYISVSAKLADTLRPARRPGVLDCRSRREIRRSNDSGQARF